MFSKNLVVRLDDIRKHDTEGMEAELQSATSKEVEDRSLQNRIQEESDEERDEKEVFLIEESDEERDEKDEKEVFLIQEESVEERDEKDEKEVFHIQEESDEERDEKEGKFNIFKWMDQVKDGPKLYKREKKAVTECPLGTRRSSRLVNHRINYSEDLESSKDIADADAEKAGIPEKIQEEESEEEEEESDESYKGTEEESEGGESDESRKRVRKVRNAKRKIEESDEESDENYKGNSTYQQMIEKNRKEKMAFLESIHMNEAKMDFFDAMKRHKPVKREKKPKARPTVLRKSDRLVNCSTIQKNYSEKFLEEKAIVQAKTVQKRILPNLSFKDALGSEDLYGFFVEDINIPESKSEAKFITYHKSDLEKMTLNVKIENTVHLIPGGTITGLTWYPSPEQLIIAGGDHRGNIGILNVNNKSKAYVMKIHHKNILNLQFNPFNPVQLISCSKDGIVCCSDMIKHTFDELYNIANTDYCTDFEFLSATTLLVAQENGEVGVVDRRSEEKSFEMRHPCSSRRINSVSVHPVHGSCFISANLIGYIDLWDLRMLKKYPVQSSDYHKKSVRSAFFSPVTGNSILTTCVDHFVRIFDSSDLRSFKFKCMARYKGKKSDLRTKATWLPKSEETLMFGSEEHSGGAVVYDKHFHVYHNMMYKYLIRHISPNVFHPTRHALACGKGCKVFVFT